jgi:branched-chain amino acid transport system substrate-binding protein
MSEPKISFLDAVIKRIDHYISTVNAKATFILAFNSVILAALLLNFNSLIDSLISPIAQIGVGILIVVILIGLLLVYLSILKAVYPDLTPGNDDSLMYFGTIKNIHPATEYIDRIQALGEQDIVKQYANQIHVLSGITFRKFTSVKHSINSIMYLVIIPIFLIVAIKIVDHYYSQLEDRTEIKIGAIVPLTGGFASYGQPVRNGMLLAIDEINLAGGINGKQLKLIIEDDASDPKISVNVFTKLAEIDKVPVILGPLSSGSSLATAPISEKNKVVQISTLAGTLDLTKAGDYIFRIYPASDVASKFIAKQAVEKFHAKNVAVFYANDAFGRTASKFVKKVLEENNIKIVSEQVFESGSLDFKPQLSRIKASYPDLIICSAYYEDGAKILVQAKQLGINLPILGEDGWLGPIAKIAGEALKNLYFANVAFGKEFTDNKIMQEFITNYTHKFNEVPTASSAAGYDGIYIIKQVIEMAGYNSESIKEALYKINYVGAFGGIRFDNNGDNVGAKYQLYQMNQNNEPILVK